MNDTVYNRRHNLLAWGLGLSLLAHVLMLVAQMPVWQSTVAVPLVESPIEVVEPKPEWFAPQEKKQAAAPKVKLKKDLEIAETEEAGNRELDPNAKILSDRNQTAAEQTRAKNIDDFRAKKGTGASEQSKGEEGEARVTDETSIGLNENIVKKDWKSLSIKDLGLAGDGVTAASDDHLDDIRSGDRTVLSTREFKYFSYYQRIKELLRQYWKPNVERQLARIWSKGKNVGEDEMVTQVQVLLDPNGSIQKIARLASSGFPEIDDAAIEAFQKAGPFPNPPKGMMDPDGLVRIRWDFILKTESAPRIQFRNAGGPGGNGGNAY